MHVFLAAAILFQDPDVEQINRALDTAIDLDLRGVPLRDAVAAALKQVGLDAGVNTDLAGDPLWEKVAVDLALKGVTARSALRGMLRPRGLALTLSEGHLLVTSRDKIRPDMEFRKYNVAGLFEKLNAAARDPAGEEWRRKWFDEGLKKMQDWREHPEHAAIVLDPEIGYVSDGIALDCRPIVSSDRRYVMLEMRPIAALLDPKPPSIASIQVPLGMGNLDAPSGPGDDFGRGLVDELITTHFGGDSWDRGASLSTIKGSLWIRQTPAVHAQIERFLRLLAELK